MNKPLVYLVGAIRDERADDITWRELVIADIAPFSTVLNPLAGKVYDKTTRKWTLHGEVEATAGMIVSQDFWCVDRADIIVANMTALAEGYPSIGSLIELGRASQGPKIIYTLLDRDYTGHGNLAMFRLHPFLERISTHVFNDLDSMRRFLRQHIKVLSGSNPHMGGIVSHGTPA